MLGIAAESMDCSGYMDMPVILPYLVGPYASDRSKTAPAAACVDRLQEPIRRSERDPVASGERAAESYKTLDGDDQWDETA